MFFKRCVGYSAETGLPAYAVKWACVQREKRDWIERKLGMEGVLTCSLWRLTGENPRKPYLSGVEGMEYLTSEAADKAIVGLYHRQTKAKEGLTV